ncbi:MAG: hypothetical protein KatS3mg097_632 [Candidatus Parcubacteria bacterium]|nr:MAG: hypothetical protein KatS3mg097_632 [Candidatus Parcubacteria bacterium]
MKKIFILFILLSVSSFVLAHSEDAELNNELQKGRELIEKLQRGEITCQNLTNKDFHSIGEYVMEQMVGGSDHLSMNQIMEKMHGKNAEELMHINMGKRFSGCIDNTTLEPTKLLLATSVRNSETMGRGMMNQDRVGYNMMGPGMMNYINWMSQPVSGFYGVLFSILGIIWLLLMLTLPILILFLLILSIVYLIKKIRAEIKK